MQARQGEREILTGAYIDVRDRKISQVHKERSDGIASPSSVRRIAKHIIRFLVNVG